MRSGAARLRDLRVEAQACRNCDLWEHANQTVFGEGPVDATLMLVGEQPGDQEDLRGHVFVGPAGRVLDEALDAAGIARDDIYLTNAVKHFKWEPRGKKRIHRRPEAFEIEACHPWLDRELALVEPEVVVCLGAVAARSLLGPKIRVTVDRGRPLPLDDPGPVAVVTMHPSSVLRGPPEARRDATAAIASDLRVAAELVRGGAVSP